MGPCLIKEGTSSSSSDINVSPTVDTKKSNIHNYGTLKQPSTECIYDKPSDRALEIEHLKASAALCICTLAHAYLLISAFPYSGFMAISLIPDLNEDNAGSAAGFIASSFMVGRTFSSLPWGKIADRYGRKFVIQLSLVFSCIFSILFGLSENFKYALAMRFCLGLSNGIIGAAKTSVSELAKGNDKLEKRGVGLVIGMWGWGFLLAPAISGSLADPVKQYPDSNIVRLFEPFLSRYPFFPPNLFGAVACLVALVGATLTVEETLPKERRRSLKYFLRDCFDYMKSKSTVVSQGVQGDNMTLDLERNGKESIPNKVDGVKEAQLHSAESCSLLCEVEKLTGPKMKDSSQTSIGKNENESSVSVKSLWGSIRIRQHLVVYWLWSFVVICIDEAFPLFCIANDAGLGLTEASIGKILSGSGLLFAVCQYFVYALIVTKVGLYRSMSISSALCVPFILIIPFSIILTKGTSDRKLGTLPLDAFIFLCVDYALIRILSMVYFSSVTIATNRTVPASQRATLNGFSMLGGSIAKAMGPAFAGILVSFAFSTDWIGPLCAPYIVFTVLAFFCSASVFLTVNYLEEPVFTK